MFSRILISVEASEPAERAVEMGGRLAGAAGAVVKLLHVVHPTPSFIPLAPSEKPASDEAERLLRESLAIRVARLGDGHPDVAVTLRELGTLVRHNGRLRESDSLLVESHRRALDRLGADHPDTRRIEEEIRRTKAQQF